MGSLTVEAVRNAKPGRHCDGDGLYLLVKPTGARSWLLRVVANGKRRDIGLGAVDLSPRSKQSDKEAVPAIPLMLLRSLSLKEAREKAAALRKIAHAGLDPVAERDRERRTIPTFAEALKLAHAEFSKGWVDKHAAAFLSSLETHVLPHIGRQRVDVIDHAMVRDALASIWTEKPVMARKVRVRINQVLGFARSKGWRAADLPNARDVRKGLAKHGRAKHFAAMAYKDAPAFLQGLLAEEGTTGRLALAFTILTGARSGEVRRASWAQIDLEARTWTRPASIMKMQVEHTIPLSDEALAVLERARPLSSNELIFPGMRDKELSDMTLSKALRTAGQATATVHGFRSTFRDWAAEQMPTIPPMVAEMALAHRVGTETERAYLRSDLKDLRRSLMDAWGAFLTGKNAVNVLPLRAA